MTTKQLIQWLRDNSSGVYRPSAEAADKIERMESALRQLSKCNFTDENCAGLDIANKRIRNIANLGLQ